MSYLPAPTSLPGIAVALLLLATAAPLEGQRALTLNQPQSGRLGMLAPVEDGRHYHEYTFRARGGTTYHFIASSNEIGLRLEAFQAGRREPVMRHDIPVEHSGGFNLTPGRDVVYRVRVSSARPGATGRYHLVVSLDDRRWPVIEESNVSGFYGVGGLGISTLQPEGQEFEDLGVGFQFGVGIGFLDRYAVFGRMIWEVLDDADENSLMTYEGGARLYLLNALSAVRPYVQVSGGSTTVERVMEDDSRATFVMGGVGLLWFMFADGALDLGLSYGVADFGDDAALPGRAPAGRLWLGFSWHPFD